MKRHVLSVLFVWTVWLSIAGSFVCAESVSLLDGKIRVYPAQREGQYILIPFTQPPEDDEEVLLLHNYRDVSPLKRLQKKIVKPTSMLNPQPHYVYGLVEGRLLDSEIQFLVVAGKAIKPVINWKAAGAMKRDESAPECMAVDQGFVIQMLQVLAYEELNVKFYYLQEELLQSQIDTMTEEDKKPATWMKETVGLIGPEGGCQVLAYNRSDAYGLNRTGTPVGPVFGIIELLSGRSKEQWLVLKSGTHAAWGYTFIQLQPMPSNREVKRAFLVEDKM